MVVCSIYGLRQNLEEEESAVSLGEIYTQIRTNTEEPMTLKFVRWRFQRSQQTTNMIFMFLIDTTRDNKRDFHHRTMKETEKIRWENTHTWSTRREEVWKWRPSTSNIINHHGLTAALSSETCGCCIAKYMGWEEQIPPYFIKIVALVGKYLLYRTKLVL